MRWDKLLEGALVSGVFSVCTLGIPLFADGNITKVESVMAIGFFLGGIGLYLKDHKSEWDGVTERRDRFDPEK